MWNTYSYGPKKPVIIGLLKAHLTGTFHQLVAGVIPFRAMTANIQRLVVVYPDFPRMFLLQKWQKNLKVSLNFQKMAANI